MTTLDPRALEAARTAFDNGEKLSDQLPSAISAYLAASPQPALAVKGWEKRIAQLESARQEMIAEGVNGWPNLLALVIDDLSALVAPPPSGEVLPDYVQNAMRIVQEHYDLRWSDLLARLSVAPATAEGWRTMEDAPKDRAIWLTWSPQYWDPEDLTFGEGRMVDGEWIACGTFYDAKRKPPYRYGEIKVKPVLWRPLPAAPTATGGR